MKHINIHNQQTESIDIIKKNDRADKSLAILLVVGLLYFFTIPITAQITFIDCECDMQPFIEITENSGSAANDATICEGEMATIAVKGVSNVTYEWSTGATESAITITDGGLYSVTVTDNTNCKAIENILILEHSRPFLAFEPTFCEGTSTRIRVIGARTYTWESGLMNQPLVVTEGGTYSVTIEDVNNCTYVQSATVNESPRPMIQISVRDGNGMNTITDNQICRGNSLLLNVTDGFASYVWQPAAGLTNPRGPVTLAMPNRTTTYSLTVTDNNGCTSVDTTTIIVNEPTGMAGADVSVCLGDSAMLTASGGVSYLWSPTTGLSNPNIATPMVSPDNTTTYSVLITDTNGCTSSDEVVVTVGAITVNVSEDQTICLGDSVMLTASGGVSYLWSPTTGLSNPNIATPMVSPDSTTTYSVLITDANGCTSSDEVMVTVNTITVNVSEDQTICLGDSVALEASGGTTYLWTPTIGLNASNIANPTASPPDTTTYSVLITDTNGCTAEDSITIFVNPVPIVSISNDTVICTNDTIQLRANAPTGTSYQWSPGRGLSDSTIANPMAFPADTTTYSVIVTNEIGCTAVEQVTVNVFPQTILQLQFFNPIFSTDSLPMCVKAFGAGTSIASLEWCPSDFLTSTTTDTTYIVPRGATGSIVYTAKVIDSNGCPAEEMTNEIRIFEAPDQLSNEQVQEVSDFAPQISLIDGIYTETGAAINDVPILLKRQERKQEVFNSAFQQKKLGTDYQLTLSSNAPESTIYYSNGMTTPIQLQSNDKMNDTAIPTATLLQNQPNPFSVQTTIPFYLPEATTAILTVFDINGSVLLEQESWYSEGTNTWQISKNDLKTNGFLYYQLRTPNFMQTKKMLMTH